MPFTEKEIGSKSTDWPPTWVLKWTILVMRLLCVGVVILGFGFLWELQRMKLRVPSMLDVPREDIIIWALLPAIAVFSFIFIIARRRLAIRRTANDTCQIGRPPPA